MKLVDNEFYKMDGQRVLLSIICVNSVRAMWIVSLPIEENVKDVKINFY